MSGGKRRHMLSWVLLFIWFSALLFLALQCLLRSLLQYVAAADARAQRDGKISDNYIFYFSPGKSERTKSETWASLISFDFIYSSSGPCALFFLFFLFSHQPFIYVYGWITDKSARLISTCGMNKSTAYIESRLGRLTAKRAREHKTKRKSGRFRFRKKK